MTWEREKEGRFGLHYAGEGPGTWMRGAGPYSEG